MDEGCDGEPPTPAKREEAACEDGEEAVAAEHAQAEAPVGGEWANQLKLN